MINTHLQAQDGWNYETGLRLRNADESIFLDASVFYYKLYNAIIRQQNANETETYVNSGGTTQPGFELNFTGWLVRQNTSNFIRGLQVNEALTLYKFQFSGTNHQLTGVPNQVIVTSVQIKFPAHLYLFVQHNYTSRIPVTDANTVFAGSYHLVQAKAGWEQRVGKTRLGFYAGIDNLLNKKYSLGNDLNAVGSRYYNAAAPRNYYMGLNLMF